MTRIMTLAALVLIAAAAPAPAQQPDAIGRWSVTVAKDSSSGDTITTAVLPGDPAQTKLLLQCIPSPESKDLFVGIVTGVDMDFRTQGKGTLQIDADPPVAAKWAFLEKMMILNEVDQPGYNAELMRRLAGAGLLTVQTEAPDGGVFTAKFTLERTSEVVRRLFDACGMP